MDNEKDLQQVLRETPWSAILIPFFLAVAVVVITVIIAVTN